MNAVDFIKMSLGMSQGWILGLAEDIKDEPLTQPTPKGGNHPLWCLGHLIYSEGNLVAALCQGQENPNAAWEELFGQGSTPTTDASDYPTMEELFAKFEEIRASTMAYLETITDADLEKPSHAEGEMKDWFGTVGQCLAAVPVHFAFHGGQIADARRAAGRSVMMG